jgi:hypothetical protein
MAKLDDIRQRLRDLRRLRSKLKASELNDSDEYWIVAVEIMDLWKVYLAALDQEKLKDPKEPESSPMNNNTDDDIFKDDESVTIPKKQYDILVGLSIQAARLKHLAPELAFMARQHATRNHPNVVAQYNEMARELKNIGVRLRGDMHDGMKVFAEDRESKGTDK